MALVLLCIMLCPPVLAATVTMDNIQVDVVADNAAAARDRAMAEARKKALLLWRQQQGFAGTDIPQDQADAATAFIDVVEEKASGQNYRGIFRVGLNVGSPNPAPGRSVQDIRNDLSFLNPVQQARTTARTWNAPGTAQASGWILLVPVHRTSSGPVVWENTDPWITEWNVPVRRRAVDFVVTDGDVEDRQMLSGTAAALADGEALRRLAEKYRAGGVALVTLDTAFSQTPDSSGIVEVTLWTPARGLMTMRAPVTDPSLFSEGRAAALGLLDTVADGGDAFREPVQTALAPLPYSWYDSQPAVIEVPLKATLKTPQRWMEIRYALSTIRGLVVKPLLVTASSAEMIVQYPGTREQLVRELQARGLAR